VSIFAPILCQAPTRLALSRRGLRKPNRLLYLFRHHNSHPPPALQLHPSRRKILHACDGSYLTRHSRSINAATLFAVHPEPRFRRPSNLFKSSVCKRPGRPARFAPSVLSPPLFRLRAHRFTDWRCTPSCRATSDSETPARSSRTAIIRRFSSAETSLRPAFFFLTESTCQQTPSLSLNYSMKPKKAPKSFPSLC